MTSPQELREAQIEAAHERERMEHLIRQGHQANRARRIIIIALIAVGLVIYFCTPLGGWISYVLITNLAVRFIVTLLISAIALVWVIHNWHSIRANPRLKASRRSRRF